MDEPDEPDESDESPAVACTVTDQQLQERPTHLWETIVEAYSGSEEQPSGYTHTFDGTDDSLVALATFVSNEHECCSFARYAIEIAPPYDETRLTITGPDGTKELFDEEFVEALRNRG